MRRFDLRLIDMLIYAKKARQHVADVNEQEFYGDETLNLAIVHCLQIIGEAASKIEREQRDRLPLVPWQAIVAMRHRIVHDYYRVQLQVVWEVATTFVPELIAALESAGVTDVPPLPPSKEANS